MSSVPFTFRIKPETKKALEAAAKSSDRTPGYLAAKAVEAFIEAREEKRLAIAAAIARADEGGHFISRDIMHDWMKAKARGESPARPKPDQDIK